MLIMVNAVFAFLNGYWAWEYFRDGYRGLGWLNLVASSVNAAAVASDFL